MELLTCNLGQFLRDRLAQRHAEVVRLTTPWPPVVSISEYLIILQRLLRAVVELVRRHTVHRDIKPDNILLGLNEGTAVIVKLGDFGEAFQAETPELLKAFPEADMSRGGAPAYLAPEVMTAVAGRGVQINYSKNDVFAVGMVAFYMLTCGFHSAFTGDRHREFSRRTYASVPVGTPECISTLLWNMVNPDQKVRFTAEEALKWVDDLISNGGPNLEHWGIDISVVDTEP